MSLKKRRKLHRKAVREVRKLEKGRRGESSRPSNKGGEDNELRGNRRGTAPHRS